MTLASCQTDIEVFSSFVDNFTTFNQFQFTIPTMTSEKNVQIGQAREAFQMLNQISQLLNTGLDQETLTICIRLCELGVDPESLAHVIKEIRKVGERESHNKAVNAQL